MTAPFSPVTASAAALAVEGSRWIWEPLAIRLGTATSTNCANSSDALNLAYIYASSDNGNVLSQAINRHGVYNTQSYSFSATQSYNSVTAYDGVNRLKSFSEPPTSGVVTENYGYDAFGNRWVTSPAPPTPETPTTQSAYSTTNRITGWGYDGSGNVTSITGMQRTFTYDAENRQVTATINGGTANTYVYDGDGRRVQKVSSAGTATYIYDAQGQLAAEYGTGANPVSGTQYLTADHLGSTRLITDGSANTAECLDYYPFGREIPTGANGRPACYSSGTYPANPDIASEKFTGKERDNETGLDFFDARYFSAAQGRFTSPDWSASPQPVPYADLTDPQTLNLYGYVRNNPLSKSDPDGHCGLFGDNPCSSLSEFISVLPDRIVGGLKGEANAFGAKFKASNAEQQEVMDNVKAIEPELQTAVMMAIPGPEGKAGEPLGDPHAPGDVPNTATVVRGGVATPEQITNGAESVTPGGNVQGVSVNASAHASVTELSAGRDNNQVSVTTAGEIRAAGGTITPSPRPNNPNHADVGGNPKALSPVFKARPNPAKEPKQ